MQFQLIDIGRNKVNETIIAKDVIEAFHYAKKYLLSKYVDLLQSQEDENFYAITAFPRTFGYIRRLTLTEGNSVKSNQNLNQNL